MFAMKKVKELSSIRFQVVILGAAVLIAVGYLAYYLFKFYRLASSVIDNYTQEEEEPDDDQPDDDAEQQPSPSPNGQAKSEPVETVT